MSRLVVFPMQKELDPFLAYFRNLQYEIQEFQIFQHNVVFLPKINSYLVVGGHGKTQFALQTQYFVDHISDVHTIYCCGSAGGLADHINVFDVVIADCTIEHDYTEKFAENAELPRHFRTLNFSQNIKAFNLNFQVHQDIIASGDEDIVDIKRVKELIAKTQAAAVAWEGAGGARTAKFNKIPFMEIRSISDNARHDVPTSFAQNLPQAMTNLARVYHYLVAI